MRVYSFLLILSFSISLIGQNDQPNIIMIFVDDLGYGDLGCFYQDTKTGEKFDTPYLDKMASEGMKLTAHYTVPVCAPSRSCILQGLSPGHASVRNNQFDFPIPIDLNLPSLMKIAGYKNFMIGKYGLAGRDYPAHPMNVGFDDFFGYLEHVAAHEHYPRNGTTDKNAFLFDGFDKLVSGTEKTYTTDVFTARAKKNIVDHRNNNPDQPFFMFLAYDVPHQKMQIPTMEYPAGKGINGGVQWTGASGSTPFVNTASGTIDSWHYPEVATQTWPEVEKKHATMMLRLDEGVEDLLQTLKDLNIDENTLVIFTSDNGPHESEGHSPHFFESYGPLKGQKRDITDGGTRVPTIAWWPGTVSAGSESDYPSGVWNWGPTFADLANQPEPARMDGNSLAPILMQNGNVENLPVYIEYFDPLLRRQEMQSIRIGDMVGLRSNIQSKDDNLEIYDIKNDLKQETDLALNFPALQSQMKKKMMRMRIPKENINRPYDKSLIPSVPVDIIGNGINYSFVEGSFDFLPRVENISATTSGKLTNFNLSELNTDKEIAAIFEGFIELPASGQYTFYLQSEDPSHMMLHDIHVLGGDLNHTNTEIFQSLFLEAGFHPIRIYHNGTTNNSFNLKFRGPGVIKQNIPDKILFTGVQTPLREEIDFSNIYNKAAENKLLNLNSNNSRVTMADVSQISDFSDWKLIDNGNGYFTIENKVNGSKLAANGAQGLVYLEPSNSNFEGNFWRWIISDESDWFLLEHKISSKILSVSGDGTSFSLVDFQLNNNSKWSTQTTVNVSIENIPRDTVNFLHQSSGTFLFSDSLGQNTYTAITDSTFAEVEWIIEGIGDGSEYFYLIHIASGRKLHSGDDYTVVDTADPTRTDDDVIWTCKDITEDPDWFHLEHKGSGERLHMRGDGTLFTIGPRDWTGGNVRWQVKPVFSTPVVEITRDTMFVCHNSSGGKLSADENGENIASLDILTTGNVVEWSFENNGGLEFSIVHRLSGKQLVSEGDFTTVELKDSSELSENSLWKWIEISDDPDWMRLEHVNSGKWLHLASNGMTMFELGPKSWSGPNTKWRSKPLDYVPEFPKDTLYLCHNSSDKNLSSDCEGLEFNTTEKDVALVNSEWIAQYINNEHFNLVHLSSGKVLSTNTNFEEIELLNSQNANKPESIWKWSEITNDLDWFRLENVSSGKWIHLDANGSTNFLLGPRDWNGPNTKWKPGKILLITKDTSIICHNSSGLVLSSDFNGNNTGTLINSTGDTQSQWILEKSCDEYFSLINQASGRKLSSYSDFSSVGTSNEFEIGDETLWKWIEIPDDSIWFRLEHKASGLWLHQAADGASNFVLGPKTWSGPNTKWRPKSVLQDTTSSVLNDFEDNLIIAFPNPSDGKINLRLSQEFIGEKAVIRVFDIEGKNLKYFDVEILTGQDLTLNMDAIPQGNYFLQVQLSNNKTLTKKISIY